MSLSSTAVAGAVFPFDEQPAGDRVDRRLATAIAISFIVHALAAASFRGLVPAIHLAGDGAAASLPALQAVLVGPAATPAEERPLPETAASPELAVAPEPVQAASSRTELSAGSPEGGTRTSTPSSAEINTSVKTIDDPARLGADYVAQLAQRFPNRVQKTPQILGAPVVDYPRVALERGLQGRFAAVVFVDALGKVADAKLVTEDAIFAPSMLEALKRMQFLPAQDEGNSVPYWSIVEFIFAIGSPGNTMPTPPVASRAPSRPGAASPRQQSATR